MCSLPFGYSVICLVSSGFGSVIELLLAAHNQGLKSHWQDAFVAKAERNIPKLKLLLVKHWKVSESIFLRLMETSGDAAWLLPFGFPHGSCALSGVWFLLCRKAGKGIAGLCYKVSRAIQLDKIAVLVLAAISSP